MNEEREQLIDQRDRNEVVESVLNALGILSCNREFYANYFASLPSHELAQWARLAQGTSSERSLQQQVQAQLPAAART